MYHPSCFSCQGANEAATRDCLETVLNHGQNDWQQPASTMPEHTK